MTALDVAIERIEDHIGRFQGRGYRWGQGVPTGYRSACVAYYNLDGEMADIAQAAPWLEADPEVEGLIHWALRKTAQTWGWSNAIAWNDSSCPDQPTAVVFLAQAVAFLRRQRG